MRRRAMLAAGGWRPGPVEVWGSTRAPEQRRRGWREGEITMSLRPEQGEHGLCNSLQGAAGASKTRPRAISRPSCAEHPPRTLRGGYDAPTDRTRQLRSALKSVTSDISNLPATTQARAAHSPRRLYPAQTRAGAREPPARDMCVELAPRVLTTHVLARSPP